MQRDSKTRCVDVILCGISLQLGWQPGDEGNILLGEPLRTSKFDREQMTQLMFEEFNVPGLFISDQAVLSLYALGKLTGCVVDLGHGKTGAKPCYHTMAGRHSIERVNLLACY